VDINSLIEIEQFLILMTDNTKKIQSNLEALQILDLIMDNIHTCCAVTMEPDDVLVLCDKLKAYIKND
jgi:hypothetical protein